jgi:uncharacterized repeat protein (TIGR03803 family)
MKPMPDMNTCLLRAVLGLSLWASAATAQLGHTPLWSFGGSLASGFPDGRLPMGALVEGPGGALYGLTQEGGEYNFGVIFRLDRHGSNYCVLHNFDPAVDGFIILPRSLIASPDGMLYGTTWFGGTNNLGSVFSVNPATHEYSVLHHFSDTNGPEGLAPSVIEGSDARLYGTTARGGEGYGAVFSLNKNGTCFSLLHVFTADDAGFYPAMLIEAGDGFLYGLTIGQPGGYGRSCAVDREQTLFKVAPDGTGFTTLLRNLSMSSCGTVPTSLVEGPDGALYWSSSRWAGSQAVPRSPGGLFRVKKDGTEHVKLLTAMAVFSLVVGGDNALYGGAVIEDRDPAVLLLRVNAASGSYKVLHNFGWNNLLTILDSNGRLYGATFYGGDYGYGSVFQFGPVSCLAIGSNGSLNLSAPRGLRFRIDYAESLSATNQWHTVTNLTLDQTTVPFVDPGASAAPQRFYRSVYVP